MTSVLRPNHKFIASPAKSGKSLSIFLHCDPSAGCLFVCRSHIDKFIHAFDIPGYPPVTVHPFPTVHLHHISKFIKKQDIVNSEITNSHRHMNCINDLEKIG